jgi:hypothetical protein
MSERERGNANEQPDRDDLENAIIAADDTGMVSNEADITNAEIREAMGIPNDSDRTA